MGDWWGQSDRSYISRQAGDRQKLHTQLDFIHSSFFRIEIPTFFMEMLLYWDQHAIFTYGFYFWPSSHWKPWAHLYFQWKHAIQMTWRLSLTCSLVWDVRLESSRGVVVSLWVLNAGDNYNQNKDSKTISDCVLRYYHSWKYELTSRNYVPLQFLDWPLGTSSKIEQSNWAHVKSRINHIYSDTKGFCFFSICGWILHPWWLYGGWFFFLH